MSPTPVPDEQTPSQPASGASLPAFLPPLNPPSRNRRPSSPRSANPSQGIPDDDAADAGSAWDEGTPEEPAETSSPASTEPAPAARFRPIDPSTRKLYEQVVEQGAMITSGLVNSRMDPEGNAFVMRPDEASSVAAPTSRLLARHVPLSGSVAAQATDLSDVVELMTALVGYVVASFARRAGGMVDGTVLPPNDHMGDTADHHPEQDQPAPPAGPLPAWPMPAGMAPMVGASA